MPITNKKTNKKFSRIGFTLVEMAMVLTILGIILAASVKLGAGQLEMANLKSTNIRMERIQEALKLYFKTNGSLPCPANGATTITTSTFGVGNKNANPTADGTASNATCALTADNGYTLAGTLGSVYAGVLPVRDLGLPDEYMFDSWGDRITYAVSKYCVDPDNWSANNTNKCAQALSPSATDGGNITVQDLSGNTRVSDAVYLILSHGKNGYGAYIRPGSTTKIGAPAAPSAMETENADFSVDSTFADGFINDGTVAANYFDDIVKWQTAPLFYGLSDVATFEGTQVGATVAAAADTTTLLSNYTGAKYLIIEATCTDSSNLTFKFQKSGPSDISSAVNICSGTVTGTVKASSFFLIPINAINFVVDVTGTASFSAQLLK